jgi:hypothetical protein
MDVEKKQLSRHHFRIFDNPYYGRGVLNVQESFSQPVSLPDLPEFVGGLPLELSQDGHLRANSAN